MGGGSRLSVLVAACLAAGCAADRVDLAPPRPDRPWVPPVTADGELIAGKPGGKSESTPAAAQTPTAAGVPAASEKNQVGWNGYVLPPAPTRGELPKGPALDQDKTYGLVDFIDLAQSTNPTTRIAWNDARRAALAAGIAESSYLPRVTASALAGGQRGSLGVSTQGLNVSNNGNGSGLVSAVALEWLLFDFGQRDALVDAARQTSLMSNIAFNATHQQVIYAVTQAYFVHAAAQARLATAQQSQKNARTVQEAAEQRYAHGVGTVVEVAQARQGAAQANLAVVQATGVAQDSYVALLSGVGLSPLAKLRVADSGGRRLSAASAAPVETIIEDALSRRPDVRTAYAAAKASQAAVRAAQAEVMPKFFLSAAGTYGTGGLAVTAIPSIGQQLPTLNVTSNNFGGTLFAGVSMPIFDGGTRAATIASAKAEAETAATRVTRVKDEAVRQIVVADNAMRTSLAAYDAAESLRAAAQTTFDAALAAYRSGVGSLTDATLAETNLLQARNAASDAYNNALAAAATMALALGRLGAAPDGAR